MSRLILATQLESVFPDADEDLIAEKFASGEIPAHIVGSRRVVDLDEIPDDVVDELSGDDCVDESSDEVVADVDDYDEDELD